MYNLHKVMEAAGASRRQIDFWTRKGYLELHARKDFQHQGDRRQWTYWSITKARLMVRLTQAGIPAGEASKFLEQRTVREDIGNGLNWVDGPLTPKVRLRLETR